MQPQKFKTIKHYHEPGDLHEFTFSCYRRMKLLANDGWRGCLARSIDKAAEQFRMQLVAFVFMPEHVHLLVYPLEIEPDISGFLAAVKRPVSVAVKRDLQRVGSRLLTRLTVRERPGKSAFRLWQEGPGYDRNFQGPKSVTSSMDYIHMNPVRRGLVTRARLEVVERRPVRFRRNPERPRAPKNLTDERRILDIALKNADVRQPIVLTSG